MFIGHFGAGLAAKKIDNKISLGTLILAAQMMDLVWPVLLLTGVEKVSIEPGIMPFTPLNFVSYPFSHSLLASVIMGALFGVIYFLIKKDSKGSFLLGALVVSHWVFDLFTHRPDLPILPWSDFKVGMGLWNFPLATMIVEVSIFAAGIYCFLKASGEKDYKFKIRFWSMILFLLFIYFVNANGAPPSSVNELAYAGLSMFVFVAWGYWIDNK